VTPFCCGTQYADWKMYNCERCKKRYDEKKGEWKCEIEKEIDVAYIGDGTIPEDIWKRMGGPENKGNYNWRCPEFEPEEAEE
jgi:hypothetical protein